MAAPPHPTAKRARPLAAVSAAVVAAPIALGAAPNAAHADSLLRDPRTGIEGAVDLGYGAFSNGAAFNHPGTTGAEGPTRGSFGFQLHAGYRFIPMVSAGAHFTFNVLSIRPGVVGGEGASAVAAGIYVRLHPLDFLPARDRNSIAGRFDLYVGAGWDFLAAVSGSYVIAGIRGSVGSNGFAFPLSLGLDFAVHPNVAVGLMGQWAPWTSFQVCSTNQVIGTTTVCDSPREAEHYFFIGAGVRVHFNVLH